jgi:hypothetical protein
MSRSRVAARCGTIAAGLTLAAMLEAATYPRWRPWCLNWGATSPEAASGLPGDGLLPEPGMLTTRAVWVGAPPASIWPWLVQMGPGRGGAYTYDWIENLFGLGMHSADRILPQYQDLRVGDAQRLGARGPVLRVAILEPERALVLRSGLGAFRNRAWFRSISMMSACRVTAQNGSYPGAFTQCTGASRRSSASASWSRSSSAYAAGSVRASPASVTVRVIERPPLVLRLWIGHSASLGRSMGIAGRVRLSGRQPPHLGG